VPRLEIITTGGDDCEAEREQWDDGNNVLAVAPALIVEEKQLDEIVSTIREVLTALDATKALDLLSREKVDAVVTDLMMPRIDGREFVRQLRSDPKTRDLPVIMVTAYGSDEAAEAGLRDGASLFLAKPLDLALLATVLRMSSRSD